MFITALLFILILAIVILVHEAGHFFSAKKLGMRVDEFGFGFPPRLFGIKKGATLYSFNLFPIGGFVKIFGEDGEHGDSQGSFTSKSVLVRSVVIVAGVFMNFVLAYLLFTGAQLFERPGVYIVGVAAESPAGEAGLAAGDQITQLEVGANRVMPTQSEEVQTFILEHKGENIGFVIQRITEVEGELKGETITITVPSRANPVEGEGATGIQIVSSAPRYLAPWIGLRMTVSMTGAIVGSLGQIATTLITSGSLPADISGPVGIASLTGQVRTLGFIIFLQFIALISLNLAILNMIPFPGLDGGRFLFLVIEKIKGSPVNERVESMIHTSGIALLLLFIAWVTFHDISKLF